LIPLLGSNVENTMTIIFTGGCKNYMVTIPRLLKNSQNLDTAKNSIFLNSKIREIFTKYRMSKLLTACERGNNIIRMKLQKEMGP